MRELILSPSIDASVRMPPIFLSLKKDHLATLRKFCRSVIVGEKITYHNSLP